MLLLLLLISFFVILVLENWTPSLSLVFFGSRTIALPLSLWILGAIFAGLLTSLLIQFLNRRPLPLTPNPSPKPPPRNRNRREEYENRTRIQDEPQPRSQPRSDWEDPPSPDWETSTVDDGWDIERPPEASTIPRPNFSRDKEATRSYEVRKKPVKDSQKGTVYRQRYQEGEEKPEEQQEQQSESSNQNNIYEADYRVITPPYRKKEDSSNEEEWEF
ncbi:hypothetical protein PN462_22140 [Spirulina sp. CS-785/01]|uniref:hypothetical protein n=1 Tax=Spirulina sp. CS-785/01 TaxID=3021716 RepID=UPI00232E2274|nr:hypothetical protein [Spirulina sp. CS-785/01]MDB9315828.1 hypothetical protein [Spirulina sp. CS-785/01]